MTAGSFGIQGYLTDPLVGWGNDDLLMSDVAQNDARSENPDIYRVLNWPDLRTAFTKYENAAKKAKASSRNMALGGAAAAGLGSALLAFTPLLPGEFLTISALLGLAMTIIGGALSAYHLVQGHGRDTWLANRANAERLRQFYFQFYINNLTLTCAAAADETAMAPLALSQSEALDRVVRKLERDQRERPNLIENDYLHEETWLQANWKALKDFGPIPGAVGHAHLEPLLERLEAQRLRIQLRYTEINQRPSLYRPVEQRAVLNTANTLLAIAIIVCATWGGFLLLDRGSYQVPIALVGVFGAIAITVRVIQHGFGLPADVERYDWYLRVIRSSIVRFRGGDMRQRALTLYDFEDHAYSELRQFLRAHRAESTF